MRLLPLFLGGCLLMAVTAPLPLVTLQKAELQVMSFNIKGLPTMLLSSDYADGRYPLIGKLLARPKGGTKGPDIVLLQEAFTSGTDLLLKEAGFPHVAQGPAANSVLGVSAGLYILSRHPILQEAKRAFGNKLCLSWDCMANKGVQFVRIAVPGWPLPLEVFNTHLQAGRTDSLARRNQVEILLEFYKEHHQEGNPVIFAGDFNFRPGLGQESYLNFVKGTSFRHAGKFCLENKCAQGPDQGWHGIWDRAVDHQFYEAGAMQVVPLKVARSYREPVDGLRLSDHPTLEVRYQFLWEQKKTPLLVKE